MRVIGIYIWISDTAFKNSTIMRCQTVKGVAEAAPISETDWDERLLIHICYSPRRWTCRNCSLSSNITSSSLRPCDFKMGRVLASIRTFKCMLNFNLRLDTICNEADEDQPPADKLVSPLAPKVLKDHCVELMSMEAPTDASTVLEPEVEATSLKAKSFWDVTIPFSSSRKLSLEKDNVDPTISESSKKAGKSTSINVIAAVSFLYLSVLVGFLLLKRS
ncbi:hypothetical protein HS088_TW12G01015 [Tripterygium wilfordii]|uniref:Uncharacterized protein n=1 Tax=Tripterygium wilfordii TaxID=458696 RepID=A0A7J7D0E2_TRIWF|nr:hypothetical protein HS088_TW12G01015 [Tripterygium wilfordii]